MQGTNLQKMYARELSLSLFLFPLGIYKNTLYHNTATQLHLNILFTETQKRLGTLPAVLAKAITFSIIEVTKVE